MTLEDAKKRLLTEEGVRKAYEEMQEEYDKIKASMRRKRMANKTKYFDYDTVKEMLYDLEYEGKVVDPSDYLYIEIPDEHGDLIDRDALANSIPEAEPHGFENCERCSCMTKDEIVELILYAEVVLERTT